MKNKKDIGQQTLEIINRAGKDCNFWICKKIEPFLGKVVLEVGSGNGNISAYLV